MSEAIPYQNIKNKKSSETNRLTDREALIRALDLMDFYAALSSQSDLKKNYDEHEQWIELSHKF